MPLEENEESIIYQNKPTTMKNFTFSSIVFTALFLLLSWETYAQNFVDFSPKFNQTLQGDIRLIGNNILGPYQTKAYHATDRTNDAVNMIYVDIDSDSQTFNSSSADLEIPNNGCYKIVHAGLYWGAVNRGNEPLTDVKFKGPEGGYIDVKGTVIYDAKTTKTGNSYPYASYADVTSIVADFGTNLGTYTVANVSTGQGKTSDYKPTNGTGHSAGWSLFIVFEDPTLTGRYITSFDGFSSINKSVAALDIPISGFQTPPSPIPVSAKFAFAALEGDQPIIGDKLRINGSLMSTPDRPSNNFFNSTVTKLGGGLVTNRNPNSTNTLGFDTGIMDVPNPNKKVIGNGDTSAIIRMESSQDQYFAYFIAFAVDVIQPKIVLTKIVEDLLGNNIGDQHVNLGDQLNYVLSFQNVGNDHATELIIRDILPKNIVFNYPQDLVGIPLGVTHTYDETTKELIFKVDKSIVEINDPIQKIRFKVTVVKTCSLLNDACSNMITNQAFTTYNGTKNPGFTISDDPSFNSNAGCLLTPGATNFLADINCDFEETVILCGTSVTLTAGNGYDSYSWSTSPSGAGIIGTGQSITVKNTGTYYVRNTAVAPCQSIDQRFVVVTYGENSVNPVIPFADEIVICPNDGKQLPNIFLCGANDVREIETNITDTSKMIWEKLANCTTIVNEKCANEDSSCLWSEVATGPNYSAKLSGQYRVTLHYEGGCFSQYYFNVYSNVLEPTATSKDITCSALGEIIVGGVPSGYEYSIDGVNYQTNNTFSIDTPNNYSVYVKQTGATFNPCIFSVSNIQIRQRQFTGTAVVSQPLCYGEKGSVKLAANDVGPQYFYSLSQGATIINNVGPVMESDYSFSNLNPGSYTATISTEDGCLETLTFEIVNPPILSATSAITKILSCEAGLITVYPKGGTPPYFYFVNSSTEFQLTPEITVTQAGNYDIKVVDSKDCVTETSIKIEATPAPLFHMTSTDILCYNSNTGEIRFNVTNANGYNMSYSIDNGHTYTSNPIVSNLKEGTYITLIKYELGGSECLSGRETMTITQADDALTASAGVSELAGCGPSGAGKVRITNPQGGTAPYQYSFDNQGSWILSNEAYVTPGTYTLYIKDANGCIYPMPGIILEKEPVAPIINISEPDFNCDGTASATVGVTNSDTTSFSYTYLLNGVENTNTQDPKTFLNVPNGAHTISVRYTLETVPTYSNLLYETFGYGEDTTSPGINAIYYCFERQVEATKCNGSIAINDGDYSVTARIISPFSTWLQPGDHTPETIPPTPKGRSLVVNIGDQIPVTAVLYEKEINDIIPNQPIIVDFYAINLIKSKHNIYDPNLLVALVDAAGNEISSFSTGNIPKSEKWENYVTSLNPGNNTSLKFILRSNVQQVNGNDVAIDDIRVYQLPKICVTQVDFPFIVATDKAFKSQIINAVDATCFGALDGTITISAQNFNLTKGFQYSMDGITWKTEMTSPITITGLAVGDYDIQVRYDNTDVSCSAALVQLIKAPSVLEVTATVTAATCITGGTINAKATGGSPAYSYELFDTASLTLIKSFPNNGVLLYLVEGNYTIKATDVNGCTATTAVSLVASDLPTAIINSASDYCYDTVNGASLEVTASEGKAPYEYSINSGVFQKNNKFFNLTPGNYNITVRDANGCIYNLPTARIAPQLKVGTVITQDLDCTASPEAIITGTISGGNAPYSYQVSINGGTYNDLEVTGTPFSYQIAIAGTYQFQIKDAKGCIAFSSLSTIDPITNPEFTATLGNSILCFGDDNGSINVGIDNTLGTPPYMIDIKNETTGVYYGTQTLGLSAGIYTVKVTDAKSCFALKTVIVDQPEAIDVSFHTVNITCSITDGVSQGSVIIDAVSGGTAPYNYFVTGTNGYDKSEVNNAGTTSVSFDVVDFGLYQINVVDANGCSVLIPYVLVASPPDDLDIVVNSLVDCSNGGEALVSIGTDLASNGPFYFSIYEGPTSVFPVGTWLPEESLGSKSAKFTGLTPGVFYTFIVYDQSTNCSYYELADEAIPTTSILTASKPIPNNVSCKGSADGSVSFEINNPNGIDANISYEIFNSLSLSATTVNGIGTVPANGSLSINNLGPLPFGNYYVLISETSGPNIGCGIITAPFTITESAFILEVIAKIEKNANCNANSGVISAIAKDGTAPYLFQISTSSTAPLTTDSSWASANTFNVNAGIYYVYAKDAYGCIQAFPTLLNLPKDPIPEIAAVINNQCNTAEGDFIIDVSLSTAGIAPYTFSINGGAFQTRTAPFAISNLSSGTYTIAVKDANGCGDSTIVEIIAGLGITPAVTAITTCSNDDGEITVTAVGGTGPFIYSINSNAPSISVSANIISGIPSGIYIISIEDSNSGCLETATVTLEQASPVDFTLTPEDVFCHGGSDGTITVNLPASNDNPIYTYEIIAGPTPKPIQNLNVFTGLEAGIYTVKVNSGRGCSNTKTIEIKEADLIVVSAPVVVAEYTCTTGTNTTNFAIISITTVTGGSGTYTKYEFIKGGTILQSGTKNVFTETDLIGGLYTINVYDNNGCVGTTSAIIKPFISLDALHVAIDTSITCTNDEIIKASVTSTGGIPTNLQYTLEDYAGIIPEQINATGIFTGLPIGNYKITVVNLETGCSLQTVHYVNDPNTFDVSVDTVFDVTCFSNSDGSINVTFIDRMPMPIDNAGPFSYIILDALGSQIKSGSVLNVGPLAISGLASGTYTIKASLTNLPFCTVDKNFTITAPSAALIISETHTEITCVSGNNDGSIYATAKGGWPGGYEYELSGTTIPTIPYASNSLFINLSAGTYTVSAKDSRGCIVTETVILTNPSPIIFTASADITTLRCFNDKNATITVDLPTGGQNSNYSYTLNVISPVVSSSGPQSSPVFSGLGAGTYSITVTDGYNCTERSLDIVINPVIEVQASLVVKTTPSCDFDATMTLSATGGTGLFSYSATSDFAIILGTFALSVDVFNAIPGTYKYYVRDANGCVAAITNDIKIEAVPTLKLILTGTNLDINCFGDNNGRIVAKAKGGLGNYVYTLQDASGIQMAGTVPNSSGVFIELLAGTYYVKVDSGDCATTSAKIVIAQPQIPFDVIELVTNVSCYGGNNGSVIITTSGGTGIIKYAISPKLNQFFENNLFEDLAPGNYEIIVQDELGCYVNLSVKITEPPVLVVSVVPNSIFPAVCDTDSDGEFSISVFGGTAPYSLSLDEINGPYHTGALDQTQFDFTGLKGGDHTVHVRDSEGCETEWNITFPESVKIEPVVVIDYLCDDNSPVNRVVVTVDDSINDLSELDFSLNGGPIQSSNVFNNVVPGIGHYIEVTHTNGCRVTTALFDIAQVDPLLLQLNEGGLNEIVATGTGGTSAYQFTLNGENYGNTSSFIIRQTGTYTVTVTDSRGCVATKSIEMTFIDICIPNYFTPNGDNNLDTWAPGCAINYPNMEFKIFDRYGREVGSYRQGQSWDGKYKERELPTGDYWYILKLNDGKDDRDFVGHFTLYR